MHHRIPLKAQLRSCHARDAFCIEDLPGPRIFALGLDQQCSSTGFLGGLYNPMVLGFFLVGIEPKNGRGSQLVGEIISPTINGTKIPQVWPVICHICQIFLGRTSVGEFHSPGVPWITKSSPHHIWGNHDNQNTMLPTFGKLDDITILHEKDIQISDDPKKDIKRGGEKRIIKKIYSYPVGF